MHNSPFLISSTLNDNIIVAVGVSLIVHVLYIVLLPSYSRLKLDISVVQMMAKLVIYYMNKTRMPPKI